MPEAAPSSRREQALGLVARISEIRATRPRAIAEALEQRRRRPLLNEDGVLFLIAADHTARGVLKAGADPMAMADRGELLSRLMVALSRPGVDGLLATADIVEDLALLGALDNKVVFGSMNRGGLGGASFELDDRFTAYTAEAIAAAGLDGGKMMVRIHDDEFGTLSTLVACADAISALAARRLPAMVEVFASTDDPDALMRAVTIASGLGGTSAYTWLKLPVVADMQRVLSATTLPTVLLGGDPSSGAALVDRWAQAMAAPQVRGLVVGRTLLYPADGDVAAAVDAAAAVLPRRQARRTRNA
ncbi:MAG TPA: hypothetical protein VGL99_08065 [Chloroflexota bacterium]